MKKILITVSAICVALSLSVTAYAVETVEPQEIIKGETEGIQTIEKIYVLPGALSSSVIPTENFTEEETEYTFVEMQKQDNTKENVKEHLETVSVYTDTSNAQKVISKFEPTLEISTEDGYVGTLTLDYTTLSTTAAGYGKQNYTITEDRCYPNLADSDTSLVPKNINKDGTMLNLTNISWQTAESDNIDGHDLAVRYTAHATYSGTGTKTYTKGYTATVQYKGEIKKLTNDTVTYTAVFHEVENESSMLIWLSALGGAILIAAGTCTVFALARRKRRG